MVDTEEDACLGMCYMPIGHRGCVRLALVATVVYNILSVFMCSRYVTPAGRVYIVWAVFSILIYVRSKYPSLMILLIVEWPGDLNVLKS